MNKVEILKEIESTEAILSDLTQVVYDYMDISYPSNKDQRLTVLKRLNEEDWIKAREKLDKRASELIKVIQLKFDILTKAVDIRTPHEISILHLTDGGFLASMYHYNEIEGEMSSDQNIPINLCALMKTYLERMKASAEALDEFVVIDSRSNKYIDILISKGIEIPKRWEQITIRFFDELSLSVIVQGVMVRLTCDELGMLDKRDMLPKKDWLFFKLLATYGGEFSWDEPEAKSALEKRKSEFSKELRKYFRIKKDPFYSYKKEGMYKTRFNLIQNSNLNLDDNKEKLKQKEEDIMRDTEDVKDAGDDLGVEEYFKEQGQSIYEKTITNNEDD